MFLVLVIFPKNVTSDFVLLIKSPTKVNFNPQKNNNMMKNILINSYFVVKIRKNCKLEYTFMEK